MAFQTIEGHRVYVVDLTDGLPQTPIVGLTEEEQHYEKMLMFSRRFGWGELAGLTRCWNEPRISDYARALTIALDEGIITEPGKYAIEITRPLTWRGRVFANTRPEFDIFGIIEPSEEDTP